MKMANLSPTARAVLTAVTLTKYDVPPEGLPAYAVEMAPLIAVALRITADHECYCLDGSDYQVVAKDDLFAIAAELEQLND